MTNGDKRFNVSIIIVIVIIIKALSNQVAVIGFSRET